MNIFTEEHDRVRERYGTRTLAENWLSISKREVIEEAVARYLESLEYFFFATSNKEGHINVNFKGVRSGRLIKVLDEKRLIFPDYGGNGIFHGIGDIASNPNVALLCIDFVQKLRVKISGTAKVIDDADALLAYRDLLESDDAQRVIEVTAHYLMPNCSQQLSVVQESILDRFMDGNDG